MLVKIYDYHRLKTTVLITRLNDFADLNKMVYKFHAATLFFLLIFDSVSG